MFLEIEFTWLKRLKDEVILWNNHMLMRQTFDGPSSRKRPPPVSAYVRLDCIRQNIRSDRLQNSRIFCERERRTIFERKVWSEWKTARVTLEGHAYGASRLPKTFEIDCFAVYRKEDLDESFERLVDLY